MDPLPAALAAVAGVFGVFGAIRLSSVVAGRRRAMTGDCKLRAEAGFKGKPGWVEIFANRIEFVPRKHGDRVQFDEAAIEQICLSGTPSFAATRLTVREHDGEESELTITASRARVEAALHPTT